MPDTSLRRTVGAGPEGVCLRDRVLIVFIFTFTCLKCRDKTQIRKILLFHVGSVLDAKRYDTHGDSNAGIAFRDYLNSLEGKYVTCDYLGYFCTVLNSF